MCAPESPDVAPCESALLAGAAPVDTSALAERLSVLLNERGVLASVRSVPGGGVEVSFDARGAARLLHMVANARTPRSGEEEWIVRELVGEAC